jgi:phosphoglycerate dehydrogenase-like enzyme
MKKTNVVLTWSASKAEIAAIKAALPRGEAIVVPPHRPGYSRYEAALEDLIDMAPGARTIMGWIAPRVMLERAPDLQLLVYLHSGIDLLDKEYLHGRNIKVVNIRGAHSAYIAEQTFALMLGLAKRVVQNDAAVHGGYRPEWWGEGTTSVPLLGQTILIVGLGMVGHAIAVRAGAFGMRRIGLRARPTQTDADVEILGGPGDLMRYLPEADFVVLSLPLTPVTRGIIGEKELRAMKPTAYLINMARGQLVSEPPLYRAVTEEWIAGFASDVWWDYGDGMPTSYHFPVPSRTGIHRHAKVLGSGDCAANLMIVKDRMIEKGCESLAAFFTEQSLGQLTEMRRGY